MKSVLVVLLVCGSFAFVSNAEASKGSVIVEILERLFKNSDEVVDRQKGQSQGVVQGATSRNTVEESPDAPEQNSSAVSLDTWSDCIMAAEQKRVAVLTAKMEPLISQATDYDRIKTLGLQLERSLARTFCAEMLRCNSSLPDEYSALTSDYQSCLADEMHDIN